MTTFAGAGISMNSIWSVHNGLVDGSLIRVLPDLEINDLSVLWLVYPKQNVLTAKVQVFRDFFLEKISNSPMWVRAQFPPEIPVGLFYQVSATQTRKSPQGGQYYLLPSEVIRPSTASGAT